MIKLDYDQALELLNRAVEEKGADYVYPEEEKKPIKQGCEPVCSYKYDGKPSCIVGYVASYLGVLDEMPEGIWASHALMNAGVDLTESAANLLDMTQEAQDTGISWGSALPIEGQ